MSYTQSELVGVRFSMKKQKKKKNLHHSLTNCTFQVEPNEVILQISPQHHEFHRL